MGASSFLNNVSKDELDNAKLTRDSKVNPPPFSPGQDEDFFGDDFFNADSGSGGGFNNFDFNGTGGGSAFDGFQSGTPPVNTMPVEKSTEDKVFDVLLIGFKQVWAFSVEVVKSFSGLTPKFWSVWGTHTAILGLGVGVFGLVVRLFGVKIGFDFLIGGLLTSATGVLLLMLNVDKANGLTSQYNTEPVKEQVSSDFDDFNSGNGINNGIVAEAGGFSDAGFSDADFFDEDDPESMYDDVDNIEEGEEDDDFFNLDNISTPTVADVELTVEDAIESLDEVPKGMYTRQFLYEAFTKKLSSVKPDFSKLKDISSTSDTFCAIDSIVQSSATFLGIAEADLPVLETVQEDLFSIRLKLTRISSKKVNIESLASEVAKSYAHANPSPKVGKSSVFGVGESVGGYSYITVFTGEKAMISIKDVYGAIKKFMLDTENVLPIVIGVDQLGNPIYCDFKNIESILITGMPRSGKTWLASSVLTQMCAYLSPKELNIYIADPKNTMSDFKAFQLPHVKDFAPDNASIVEMLRYLVNVEGERRVKIIGDAGYVNIWDYKERYPDVELPLIYVVIDELVTLADSMDKETKAEFQGYLSQLISRLPASGIRAILIPHLIKDDIIKKRISSLIQCRISVCGDQGHIDDTTGAGAKEFPYKLQNTGDTAVRIPEISKDVMFVHSTVLTPSNNKNKDLYEYLRRMWGMLEPESVKNSYYKDTDAMLAQEQLVAEKDAVDVSTLSFEDLSMDTNAEDTEIESSEVKSESSEAVKSSKVTVDEDEDFINLGITDFDFMDED